MANWFDRIKKYYDAGLWTATMVGNAVVRARLPAEQYKEITGTGLQQVNLAGIFTLTIGLKPGKDNIMYPNNIYIKNYAETRS